MEKDPNNKENDQKKSDITKMYIGDEAIETWSLLSGSASHPQTKPQNKPAPPPRADPPPAAESVKSQVIHCPHCKKPNEQDRQFCWACFMPMAPSVEQQDHGVIIRKSYLFVPDSQTAQPPPANPQEQKYEKKVELDYDHQSEDSDRIRTRTGEEVIKFKKRDIQIFKGSHLIAVRMDGKNYTSEDMNIPLEAKMIIRRVQSGEPLAKIMDEFKGIAQPSGARNGAAQNAMAGRFEETPEEKSFFKKFSTIIIIGLVLVFLFVLLNMFKG
jgi:hypothetical protein